jgi:DNA-directed RNA polymerase subunit RPC12/RpoP
MQWLHSVGTEMPIPDGTGRRYYRCPSCRIKLIKERTADLWREYDATNDPNRKKEIKEQIHAVRDQVVAPRLKVAGYIKLRKHVGEQIGDVPAYLLYCEKCGFTSIAEHVHYR